MSTQEVAQVARNKGSGPVAVLQGLLPATSPRVIARNSIPRKSVVHTREALLTPARPFAPTPTPETESSPDQDVRPSVDSPGTWLSNTYRGGCGTRPYQIYVPSGLRRKTAVPLVVMLHGCTQNAREFAQSTQFNALADRHGFVVAYPEQTLIHNGQRCWQWYKPGHQARDEGEPAIIAGITEEVIAETERWRIDPKRVYVAGISAGGAMSLILGATYPDVYAAIGVHSAPPYRSADTGLRALRAMMGMVNRPPRKPVDPVQSGMPPAIVFQGATDKVVNAINGERIAQQWLAFHEAGLEGPRDPKRVIWGRTKTKRSADGRRFRTTTHYSARGRRLLELWRVDELGHAWSGGAEHASYSDPQGPHASTAMWRFFKSHSH